MSAFAFVVLVSVFHPCAIHSTHSIWRMFLASSDAIGLLFGCLFIYAVAGVMLFGGLIFDGNDALDETDYRDSGYDGGRECRAPNRSVHYHRLFSWLTTHTLKQ